MGQEAAVLLPIVFSMVWTQLTSFFIRWVAERVLLILRLSQLVGIQRWLLWKMDTHDM